MVSLYRNRYLRSSQGIRRYERSGASARLRRVRIFFRIEARSGLLAMQSTSSVEQRNNEIHVAICVATFRRPRLLKNLLGALAQLCFRNILQPKIDVIVVDNDDSQSARSICQLPAFPWKLHYVSEPRRGIVHARNRAIMEARGANFLAFIDDDEAPCREWLDELLAAQSEYDADVVSGIVQPWFAKDVPMWVKGGGFFHRPAF